MKAYLWDSYTGTTHNIPLEFLEGKTQATFGLVLVRDVLAALGASSFVTRCSESKIFSLSVYTFQTNWHETGTIMVDWTP